MFEWKPEYGWLMKQRLSPDKKIYDFEKDISREDKIQFLNSLNDKFTIVIELFDKFSKEKADIPKDNFGNVKTVSLKAWLKRNDKHRIFDAEYRYGKLRGLSGINMPERYIESNAKLGYDYYDDIVDETFRRTLQNTCLREEKEYFRSHDEYQVLVDKTQKALSNGEFYTFGVLVVYGSDGIHISDDKHENYRRATLEELKVLWDKNEQVREFVDMLTKEGVGFDYNNQLGETPDKKKMKEFYGR